ncbi:MAG TPA: outer membrane lipoprotein carrier protein LolA [Bryobacteraceae bacterium]|nr:outer membrane lipoprotein carrier protein LolA [Bryobacteraceae bacterium]
MGLIAVSAFAADARVDALLKEVESHYNQAKTLQVLFQEDYTAPGKARATDRGILMLRKPGRMRWDYSQPAGKWVVSDNKSLYVYTPADHKAHQLPLQESDDMKAPLAFLLGKLDFSREFKNLQSHQEGFDTRITGEPKTDNLPYSAVEFLITRDSRIREVKVTGFDNSVIDFVFDQERLNPTLDPKLFQFQLPKGAELVQAGQ